MFNFLCKNKHFFNTAVFDSLDWKLNFREKKIKDKS